MRLLVYSHDTFGLGNIKRMLAICTHLHAAIPDLSILIVSGSPMLHSFRVSPGIDYIKLPCLKRSDSGDLGVRFLELEVEEVVRLRREIILATIVSFKPDIVLVDKKPEGLAGEMEPSLRYIRCNLPQTRTLLVLRDILDAPASTIRSWTNRGSYKTIEWYYDDVLILGSRQIFDACAEYRFPATIRRKVHFCGYIAREAPARSRNKIRHLLGVAESEKLVLVTTGGGEDGFHVLSAFIEAIKAIPQKHHVKAMVVAGPELAVQQAKQIRAAAQQCSGVQVVEFIDDMMSYMNAADVVVSMAGYNTICELLTLGKQAIVVPRVTPVEEQKIRAERMAMLSIFRTILPHALAPAVLGNAIVDQLKSPKGGDRVCSGVDLGALTRISEMLLGGTEVNMPIDRTGNTVPAPQMASLAYT
ncbi:MAG: glycosyltransferase family protein [Acidobacteriaceae bacterium]